MKRSAFTLVELLTVVGIVGVLAGLLGTAIARGKRAGRMVKCMSNVRQIISANIMYSDDDLENSLSGKVTLDDESVVWLQEYLGQQLNVLICPNTKNRIRNSVMETDRLLGTAGLTDLMHVAGNRDEKFGQSYQHHSFMGKFSVEYDTIRFLGDERRIQNYVRKSSKNVMVHKHFNDAFGLRGTVAGPSGIWLFADNAKSANWNFPDSSDNHGTEGGNIGFCDGHAEWIDSAKYVYKYELSEDENRSDVFYEQ